MALGGFSDLTTRLRSEIEERRMIEADLRDATFELSRQRDSLETRVAERTLQLERQAYALQSVNSALERSNEHLSSFAHIASHDMREPLRSMSTHLHLLEIDRAEEFSDEAKHRLGRIKHLARRMEKMVSDLLEFAQISDGQDEPSLVDPVDVIESIRENLADFILKHKADIQVATSMPNLYVPKSCLNIIFQNLIQNGIKYNSSQNKVVSIGCDASVFAGEQPIFYVLDNGIGIDPSVSAQIFTMFKRVSRTNDDGDGTGSGLSFVKRVIEGLGGKIWLDSKVGVGSTFYFSLGRSVLVEEKGAKDGAGREKTHSADR
ncbi:MAG: ATP-binding protein [Neomegalonema sp.]|nr:ATP-binding protein [Neomegalonema sp.]